MNKYIKVMFGNKGVDYEYKIDEVNVQMFGILKLKVEKNLVDLILQHQKNH